MTQSATQGEVKAVEVALLIGLQGSGKSTFYRQHLAATHAHVSLDVLRSRKREVAAFVAYLRAGKSVAVDDTTLTRAHRQRWLTAAEPFDARVVGYWLQAGLADCLARNAQRQGKARVPDAAIHAAARSLEPPELTEGFAALYAVATLPGHFEITPL